MTEAILYLAQTGTQIFRFEGIRNLTFTVSKTGIEDMEIPGQILPITFDAKTMERIVIFDWIIYPTTYNTGNGAGGNGSGSILDQLDDLDYYIRSQADVLTSDYKYRLEVSYPAVFDATHTPKDSFGGVTANSALKNHYVYFKSLTFPRLEGEPRLVIARVEMKEVDTLFGL